VTYPLPERKLPPPRKKKPGGRNVQTTIYLEPALLEQIKARCEMNNRSLSAELRDLIITGLKRDDRPSVSTRAREIADEFGVSLATATRIAEHE
jgi:hypothetical protein